VDLDSGDRTEVRAHARTVSGPFRVLALRTIAGCAGAFVVLWIIFIRLEAGRRFGDRAWSGREALSQASRNLDDQSLRTITAATLLVACVALVVVGVVRRRALLGVAAATAVGAAAVSAEVFKRVLIDRPATPGEFRGLVGNSFPSGHVTICTALALAALMLTPHRWRRVVGAVAALWVTLQATGVLAAGWHRPSDALCGLALGLGWVSFAVWALAAQGRVVPDSTEQAGSALTTKFLLGTVLIALSGLAFATVGNPSVAFGDQLRMIVASVVIDVVGVAVVWWFWRLLRAWALDPPAAG